MILLTGFYRDPDQNRRAELYECLQRNVEAERLDEIHLFLEEPLAQLPPGPPFNSAKVQLVPHGQRVTFRDLFVYANRQLAGATVIIANADIFFDHTLARLDGYDLSGTLLCISRWDVRADGSASLFEHPGSQDAWIFRAPIRSFYCNFNLGVLGCDNRLAWEAEQVGLKVTNPSRSVRANHLHLSQVRRYGERQRLAGPTASVPAVVLETPYPGKRGPAPEASCARVKFRETMGYTISRLEPAISSHNNEPRPFKAIPAPLAGLQFTQVVAYAVSSLEIEFLTSGKLYVLVGNDWDGHQQATEWLNVTGFRERLPLVETQDKIGFEVWSLVADAGERFVLPTQVMLVADQLVRNEGPLLSSNSTSKGRQGQSRETIFALTSLSPQPESASRSAECIKSWRNAGLQVRAFNHPSEISKLAALFDVAFVPIEETSEQIFGRHFIPIKTMLDWAAREDAAALLINADIHLQLERWEIKRLRWLSNGGLCYFVRYNHDGDQARASREPYGIDAFLLHGRDANLFPDSFLSMGQPFWDYWIPHTFASHNRPICGVEFPAAFHRKHRQSWSWQNWHRCALEFNRITGQFDGNQPFEAAVAMSVRVRQHFEQQRTPVAQRPGSIREWVQQTFRYPGAKTFLELGAHQGTDTMWMAEIPDVTIQAFEPDPRNHPPARRNVIVHRAAIADCDGPGLLILSQQGWGREWTHSSSIKQPRNHLSRFPVTFGGAVPVEMTTLDRFCEQQGIGVIDFIWADIQGAEGEMIRGGRQSLARTRYLYTEYSDDELYENQATLGEILEMLPDFRVIELWSDDVLLENQKLKT
jgi:FkbM family methyltransferase